MGKHYKEEKKFLNKKFLLLFFIIIVILGIAYIFNNKESVKNIKDKYKSININNKQQLVLKSTSDYNRIIKFEFENDILNSVKIYEQFEEKERFEQKKKNYELDKNLNIIDVNNEEYIIEIEKNDFGSDAELSYEQIYDKYLNQIIGAYEVIE